MEIPNGKIRSPDVTRAIPLEPKDVDLVLVPGVAFTKTMGRLGQGGGYYDRVLSRLAPNGLRIGIAFEAQMTDGLPLASHDVAMDAVLTEVGVYGNVNLLNPIAVAEPVPSPSDAVSTIEAQSGSKIPAAQLENENMTEKAGTP
jgi:5-formyltetrahydrofolate cyclo-ligase family